MKYTKSIEKEIEKLIKDLSFKCTIREFKDKVDWGDISSSQKLSEDFIREFKDKVDWGDISSSQKLSEDFIREFKDKVDWRYISFSQKLSEDFIREFKDKVDWGDISSSKKLSEDFIREFKDKVAWRYISSSQKLSLKFCKEFKLDDTISKLSKKINPVENALAYAKKHKLKVDKTYLYAFRKHDSWERGVYFKNIYYEKGKYYKDWRCDPRTDVENSYGLGIFPSGNTQVRVKLKDFCVEVNRVDGKARVWGFEII